MERVLGIITGLIYKKYPKRQNILEGGACWARSSKASKLTSTAGHMFHFENTRYNRQETMPEWGHKNQELLKSARVAVIGAGGVKSTLLMSLAAGGIGNIRIIEFDKVELSNLNRQILYRTSDIGKSKGEQALKGLKDLNPEINIELIKEKIIKENIYELLEGYDYIYEGGDCPAGRNLVNEYFLDTGKIFTHASAQFSYGHVFSMIPEEKTSCFACLFPNDFTREEHTGAVPVNVLATSVAGSLGAAEAFKWYMGYKDQMNVNSALRFSSLLLSSSFSKDRIPRKKDCPVCSKYY